MSKKKTTERFIEEAKKVHGDKYDYSLVDYKGTHTKVKIICPIHGVFEQIPSAHLGQKQGCPICAGKNKTTDQFIQKAKEIHGDKYDYSLVDYRTNKTKIKIICPIHGVFEQIPSSHLSGSGCPKCGINKLKTTLEQFIQKAKEIHGDKYDYSLVDYRTNKTKIKIKCNACGKIFEQTPNSHLNGNGCPICAGFNKTTERFIEDAKKVHGDKYDYSLVDYKDAKTKIKIICPIHGVFEQIPNNHLNSQGCLFCYGTPKKTTEQFIKEAKKIHGDKYDYSLVDYKDVKTKVKILCPIHGVFEQTPGGHLSQKQGCPVCAGTEKLTTEQFIQRAKEIHGDKYDYSLVDYKDIKTKVKIICPIHGVFEQTPASHLKGYGCKKCSGLEKLTTEQFIQKAKEVHGDKYDYSLVDYQGNRAKVKIKCKTCNKYFWQLANSHLRGTDCPFCYGTPRKTTEQFIKEAKEVHGDKYDYSLVDYKDTHTKVKIICPIHGVFEQTPDGHLQGAGCPFCNESRGEKEIARCLEKMNIFFEREYKFPDCKNKLPLFFDFRLPNCNTCIEYDGEQHFKAIEHFGGEEGLKRRQENDKIKTDYCLKNHIRLIRIRYWETVKDILDLYNLK